MAVLTPEQEKNYYATQGNAANPLSPDQYLASLTPSTITSESLQPVTPLDFPKPQDAPVTTAPNLPELIKQAQNAYAPDPTLEKQRTGLEDIMAKLSSEPGKAETRAQAEADLGVQAKREAAQASAKKLQLLQAERDTLEQRLQSSVEGRGVTEGGLAPIRNAQQRDLDIRTRFAVAEALVTQGDLNGALGQVQQAVDDKYSDQQTKITNVKTQLDYLIQKINDGTIQKTKAMELAINERNRILTQQQKEIDDKKAEEKSIQEIAIKAIGFGADADTIARIQKAGTLSEAIAAAGTSLQDPKFKYEIEKIKLDIAGQKLQNAKTAREIDLLGEPSAKEKKEMEAALKNAKASVPVMQDKIDLVDALNKSPGLTARVGTSFLSRVPQGEGFLGGTKALLQGAAKIPLTLGTGTFGDISQSVTGSGQSFAGGVHKLVAGLSLDSLIQAKNQGATFGALSDSELRILANSATALNDWEIKDKNGVGTGVWNIDEASFKKELSNIQNLTQRAIRLSSGETFTKDESSILDNIYGTGTISPADYFQ